MRLKAEVADESGPTQTPAGACGKLDRTDHLLTRTVSCRARAKKLRKNGHLSPSQSKIAAWYDQLSRLSTV